jgi:predicted flap endonuclease-1-like 5' DNA nuclease
MSWLDRDGLLARIVFGPDVSDDSQREWPRAHHANIIAPSSLVLSSDKTKTRDMWTGTLFVESFPDTGRSRMLYELHTKTSANVDVNYHLTPTQRNDAVSRVEQGMHDLEVAMAQKQAAADVSVRDSVRRLQDHEDVYDRLTRGNDELFDTGIYVTVRAESEDQLDTALRDLKQYLDGNQLTAKRVDYRQQDALVTGSPIGKDALKYTTPMLGSAVGTMYPFCSSSLAEDGGVMFGYHMLNRSPIIVNRFDRDGGYNVLIIGKVGSGKSFTSKLNLLRTYAMDPEVMLIVIDPMGEFYQLTETLGGAHIPIDGKRALNALEIQQIPEHIRAKIDDRDHNPLKQAKTSALDLLNMFFTMQSGDGTGLSAEQQAFLGSMLNIVYARQGITTDPATHGNPSPTLADLDDLLWEVTRQPLPFRLVDEAGGITPQTLANHNIATPLDVKPDIMTSATPDTSTVRHDGGQDTTNNSSSIEMIEGLIPEDSEQLKDGGIETVADLADTTPATVATLADVTDGRARRWVDAACEQIANRSNNRDVTDQTVSQNGGTQHVDATNEAIDFDVSPTEYGLVEADLEEYRQLARSIRLSMTPFREGHRFDHLARSTDIDLMGSDMLYLDLDESETEQEQSLMMKLLYRLLFERAKTTDKKVILAIDEAHMLIQDSSSLNWLERSTRHSRHHNLSIQLMTQSPQDLLTADAAKIIGENTDIRVLHYLKQLSDDQRKYLDISEYEAGFIKSATQGNAEAGFSQALLAVDGAGHYPLQVEALTEEARLFDPTAVEHI